MSTKRNNANETDNRKITLFLQPILIDNNGNFGRGCKVLQALTTLMRQNSYVIAVYE